MSGRMDTILFNKDSMNLSSFPCLCKLVSAFLNHFVALLLNFKHLYVCLWPCFLCIVFDYFVMYYIKRCDHDFLNSM